MIEHLELIYDEIVLQIQYVEIEIQKVVNNVMTVIQITEIDVVHYVNEKHKTYFVYDYRQILNGI